MKILFVHQSFPAQFGHLASWLNTQPQHTIVCMTRDRIDNYNSLHLAYFAESREVSQNIHYYLRPIERAVLQGQAAYRSAIALKQTGFIPDVIYGHSGFGATLFMKDIFPNSPFVGLFEWYYHSHGSDVGFGPDDIVTADDECRIRTRNMLILPDLVSCNIGITPTNWQKEQFPSEYASKLNVLHDGIDIEYFTPQQHPDLCIPSIKCRLPLETEIVTYVGRGMEKMRGFPQFMESMSILMQRRKNVHVVVVGTDQISYGPPKPDGSGLKQDMLNRYSFDMERLHFTGHVAYGEYRKILQASTVHVYLTRPFVLSWSILEAMASGCALVASDTPPVREVITHDFNGLLFPFFDATAQANAIEALLKDPLLRRRLSDNARATVIDRYDVKKILPQQYKVLERAVTG